MYTPRLRSTTWTCAPALTLSASSAWLLLCGRAASGRRSRVLFLCDLGADSANSAVKEFLTAEFAEEPQRSLRTAKLSCVVTGPFARRNPERAFQSDQRSGLPCACRYPRRARRDRQYFRSGRPRIGRLAAWLPSRRHLPPA